MIEKETIESLLMKGKCVNEITEILKITVNHAYKLITKYNLKEYLTRHPKTTSEYSKQQIYDLYLQKQLSMSQIAKKLNLHECVVGSYLKKISVKEKRPWNLHLNHNIFESIDTEEKAYWLGMLYADGCVRIRSDANSISCSLKLKSSDLYHVTAFRDFLGSNLQVRQYKNKATGEALIRVYSLSIGKDLIRHGCVPNKSLILEPPSENTLPKRLNRHFIRGFFDGDGCVTRGKNGFVSVYFYSTYNMISWIKKIIEEEISVVSGKIVKQNNIFTCSYRGKDKIFKIIEYLYQDSTVKLERKYNIFENYKLHIAEKSKEKLDTLTILSDSKLIGLGRDRLRRQNFVKKDIDLLYGKIGDRSNCYAKTHDEYVDLMTKTYDEIRNIIAKIKK